MANQTNDKSQRGVFRWIFVVLFLVVLLGAADPLVNDFLDTFVVRELNAWDRFWFDLTGPDNPAQHIRNEAFGSFFQLSFLIAAVITTTAWGIYKIAGILLQLSITEGG